MQSFMIIHITNNNLGKNINCNCKLPPLFIVFCYKVATDCHDNGNVGHVCAKFTCAVLYAHSKG